MKNYLNIILLIIIVSFIAGCSSSFPTKGIRSITVTSEHGYTVVTPDNDTLHSVQTSDGQHELTLSVKSNHITGITGAIAGLPHSPSILAPTWQFADSAFSTVYYGPLADISNKEITFDTHSKIELLMLPADTGYVNGSEEIEIKDNSSPSLQCKVLPYLQRRSYSNSSKIAWGTFAGWGAGMLFTAIEGKNEFLNGKWGGSSLGMFATILVAPFLNAIAAKLCGDNKDEGGDFSSALKGALYGAAGGLLPTLLITSVIKNNRIQPTLLAMLLSSFFGSIGATIGYNSSTPHARLIAIPPNSHIEIKYPLPAPPMFQIDTEEHSLLFTPAMPDVGMLSDGITITRLSLFSVVW